jgi:PAS domain S-box-containing protein
MSKLIAKDLMTARPMALYTSDTLEAAIQVFSKYRVSSAAVMTPDKDIVGVLTDTQLMKLFIASIEKKWMAKPLLDFQSFLLPSLFVFDLDPIAKVMSQMNTSVSGRVLVLDSQKRLIGIISPKDVFQFLSGETRPSAPMHEELTSLKKEIQQKNSQLERASMHLSRLENLINGSSYMMHSIDLDGKIILANRRLHEVLEYNYGELVGKKLEDLYDSGASQLARDQLKRLADGKEQDAIRTAFRRKGGQAVMVEILSSTVKDRDGNFVATSSMSRLMDSDELLSTLHRIKK